MTRDRKGSERTLLLTLHRKGDRLTGIYECTYRSFLVFYGPLVSLGRRNCVQVPCVEGLVCLISSIKGKLVPS